MNGLFLYGMLTGIALTLLPLIAAGVLHIKGKIRMPGSPEIDRATGVKRDEEGGATKEDVR